MSELEYELAEPKIGGYAMHYMHCKKQNGTLVQVVSESNGYFGIRYVPSGGGSYSWPPKEFGPVTDPLMIAITRYDDACQKKKYHDEQSQKRAIEIRKWEGVIECLKEADKNIKALK
jgi:hypothetical protein